MITIIPLRFMPGYKWVHLRELCGRDELMVSGPRSIDAIQLLDRLLSNESNAENVVSHAAKLVISDRDRILAAVYVNTYGPDIATSVNCSSCHGKFDINFPLDSLVEDFNKTSPDAAEHEDTPLLFKSSGGGTFRLLTGDDEMAVLGMDPENAEKTLLKRCMVEVNGGYDPGNILQEMQEVAPLVDTDFEAKCPECSEKQNLHFNLQQYLLSSLMKEQKKLAAEIHQIARAYGWGLNEILGLPRSIRRTYVSMLESNSQ